MIYYRAVDLPGWPQLAQQVLAWIMAQPQGLQGIKQGFGFIQDPELAQSVDQVLRAGGWRLDRMALFVLVDPTLTEPHIDWGAGLEARINLPVLNANSAVTEFFSADDLVIEQRHNQQGLPYYHAQGTWQLRDSVIIDQPYVLRIREPHRVRYSGQGALPRITLSLRVYPDPVLLLG